ncbi:Mechanosensitive channel MscK precursor [Rubripirellula amarantea]|uniref:Mechanosensitive channel MscK n=1 Tax=Rubripirellula amarantea TaxID=2527999 RepID=A0A5C5WJW5_9BACT|nr:mechanosensitive ion channel domain-containing protein [Rubripirellula amarantea]TWT50429.1 Mechanosensitive channel MscK precursor [Rubripirellula amarantea]
MIFLVAPVFAVENESSEPHATTTVAEGAALQVVPKATVVSTVRLEPPANAIKRAEHQRSSEALLDEPSQSVSQVTQVSGEGDLTTETSAEVLEEKQVEVATELRIAMLQEEQNAASDGDDSKLPTADASRVDLLKQIDVVIAQQQSATSSSEDHSSQVEALKSTLTRLADGELDSKPPYSIILLDGLKESARNAKSKLASAESSVVSARGAAETAKTTAEERATSLRQLREKADGSNEAEVQIAELEQKLAEEMLVLRRQELSIAEANQVVAKLQLEIDEKKIAIVGDRIVFTQEDLTSKLADLDKSEVELKQQAARLQTELQFAERRWLAARQEADASSVLSPELIERVDSLKISQMAIQNEMSLTNQRLQRLPLLKKAWERRFLVVANQVQRKERNDWADETNEQLEQIAQDRQTRRLKLDELRVSQSTVDAKIDAANGNEEVARWLRAKRDAYDKQAEVYSKSLLALDSSRRTLERLKTQIEGEPGRSVGEIAEDTWTQAKRLWNYELTSIEDTSLTVGKVCSSILMLFFGFLLARWLSHWVGGRLPKWGVDEAAADAIESLSFYALLITLGLTALRYANVPLTVFTFLGGAIAIGIGFGSQNILNNFISGLILLAERPIKVGDLIKIGDTHGNVTKIGARSTQIRTGDNQDIIVPNSSFLENEVTNLTRRDDRQRTSITIGVAYGSDLDAVLRLLARAASEQSGVLERPKPMVWFNDFGDNSLVFQVHFWVQAKNLSQMRMIETGVRLKIDAMFREAEIVIAFPQRDLHIQSPRPIDFRLVTSGPDDADSHSRAA